jgi:hypothetical protein
MSRWLVLLLLPACLPAQQSIHLPMTGVRTGAFQDPRIDESSGVALSSTMPRVLYTLNDSGNDATLFAFDSSGRPLGSWLVPGLENRDWEALSRGPCPSGSCLYIGDVGDNLEQRPTVVLYRLREPGSLARFRGARDSAPLDLDSLTFRYPDRPHDVEALWVDRDGRPNLITKGRSGPITMFRLPADGFGSRQVLTATLVQELPLRPDQGLGRWVTDAALAPDGRTVAVRTYTDVYLFPLIPTGRLGPPVACHAAGYGLQGEGIVWLDQNRLLLTSERPPGTPPAPIYVVTCNG